MKTKNYFLLILFFDLIYGCSEPIKFNENPPTYIDVIIFRKVNKNLTFNKDSSFNVRLNSNHSKAINFLVNLIESSGNSTISPSAFSLNSSTWNTGKI